MRGGIGLVIFFLALFPAAAGDPPRPDPTALAAEIDRLVNEKLKAHHVSPAPRSDDAIFFRRINLALAGRVAVPSEVRAFLADSRADKRANALERLLGSPAFANHLTTCWRGWLLQANTNFDVANAVPGFEAWMHSRIRAGTPLDRIVNELLTYPLDGRQVARRLPGDADVSTGPLAFYLAKEGKPENLAAAETGLGWWMPTFTDQASPG